ncbi:unnamed protein product [Owenia fusiformis]|uniref:Transposase n=1 Tax=Owenia fusiformis TaxID=6347 RepID=A0A8S4NNM9_OWEFU|nr:unnamed protein product [Owenia fusiformis]
MNQTKVAALTEAVRKLYGDSAARKHVKVVVNRQLRNMGETILAHILGLPFIAAQSSCPHSFILIRPITCLNSLEEKGTLENKRRSGGQSRHIPPKSTAEKTLIALAKKDKYASTSKLCVEMKENEGIIVSKRTIRRHLYERNSPNSTFKLKGHNLSTSKLNLDRVLDMQMGYLEGLKHALERKKMKLDDLNYQEENSRNMDEFCVLNHFMAVNPMCARSTPCCLL